LTYHAGRKRTMLSFTGPPGNQGRSLMILGAGPRSIGEAVFDRISQNAAGRNFNRVTGYTLEDFDARQRWQLRSAIEEQQPTDVVFCIGTTRMGWTADVHVEDFRKVMETNVYTFLNLIKILQDEVLVPPVSVVAVTSDAAWRPMRASSLYCASKAALEMAIRVASRELAPAGWRVNGVAPGKVADTPMTDYVDEEVLKLRRWTQEHADAYEKASSPLGRPVTKSEVAEVILYVLNGPKAQTGEIIAVNGGR
jgi:NAD(P)-dependent dehydrogenase (short-subunit alcohol dehydrogenase family)